jgi:hypothetical protein
VFEIRHDAAGDCHHLVGSSTAYERLRSRIAWKSRLRIAWAFIRDAGVTSKWSESILGSHDDPFSQDDVPSRQRPTP